MTGVQKVWVAIGVGVIIQLSVAGATYQSVYRNIVSMHQYQRIDDQNHNKTTQDLEICEAQAVINHSMNWKSLCKKYGLPESCGLPQDDYNYLAENLKSETSTCIANHQYQIPTVVGPAFDSEGHLLNQLPGAAQLQ